MTTPNLSRWALDHRSFVWFVVIASLVGGFLAYERLGREEDPAFTVKTMVIRQNWPGATVDEMLHQVQDRIEKELKQLDVVSFTRSYSVAGQTTILVDVKDTIKPKDVPWAFYRVRKHVEDIQRFMPRGVLPPGFDDEFGDVFGSIYGFTADGIGQRQLRDEVERIRSEILTLPNCGKVVMIGAPDEVIYLNFETRKLAALSLNVPAIIQTLQSQNAVQPSGVIQSGPEQVSIRVSGGFVSEASLRAINLRIGDRFLPLSEIADIARGPRDPPAPSYRVEGRPAIGLGIGMLPGADLLRFGRDLKAKMRDIEAHLPLGVGVHLLSDQPKLVDEAVGGFTEALGEAVLIVLAVSFLSLGLRAGLVVSCSIPIVLGLTFVAMSMFDISLQRISLGALIIALGLLVDDAMITVETMVTRLEHGDGREAAATFAYTSTAFPMLTGTLVTVAGFIPIGFNQSTAGEYTSSLFVVVASSLLLSWLVAVLIAPLIGVKLLREAARNPSTDPGRLARVATGVLVFAMRRRWLTIAVCVAALGASVVGLGRVQQQFFPSSDRPELVVDFTLSRNSTIAETDARVKRFEAALAGDPDVETWSDYVGQGSVRFYLPLEPQLDHPFFAQSVILARSLAARDRLAEKLLALSRRDFADVDVFIHPLELGPPVGHPVQYRVSGPDLQALRAQALKLAAILSSDRHLRAPTLDWNEPGKVVRVELDQDKARQLGISTADLSGLLDGIVGGTTITQVRDDIYLVDVVGRAGQGERDRVETLQSLQIPTGSGKIVPLLSIATLAYELEQPIVWTRDGRPTITVRADIDDGAQPPTVVASLAPEVERFARELPDGFKLAVGGAVEESAKGQAPIVAILPIMLLAIFTLVMIQLQSFGKAILVISVAPLGLIGVVAALLASNKPLGFVALLGILALIGIIIRNSVILVAQIDAMLADGRDPWSAVVEATLHRTRPILLTAGAASFGLIPIAPQVFWGPMAYAMIGGILAATVLTLLFLPALYIAWYGIREVGRVEA